MIVQAYVIFEVGAAADDNATTERLRSTSLGNCKQLIIGRHARDVFVHIACDEQHGSTHLQQAMLDLSRVEGVVRATLVSVKHSAE